MYDNLKRDGPNILSAQPKTPKLISFLENLFGGFGFLLLTGAALCFIAYTIQYFNNNSHLTDSLWLGIALIFVDFLSACFAFYQEEKCKQIIESFRKIVPQKAKIVRDGVIQVVQVENIVVGDIVLIKAGDKVPADMRLFEADKLYVITKISN